MLHDARKIIDPDKKPWFIRFRMYLKKNKKKIRNFIILLFISIILFFPIWSGGLIGNWIKDFIGTILDIIKTI